MEFLYLLSSYHYCHPAPKPRIPLQFRRFRVVNRPCRFVPCSKKSDFQDFQGYAKPTRLLPASEPKVFTNPSPEKSIAPIEMDESQSLYKVLLRTSSVYGSELSDINAGILVCIIDENGNSMLQRIPAISEHQLVPLVDTVASDVLHFQRASVDEFAFWGPKLGRIQVIWISPESGRWRLGCANLIVLSRCGHHPGESREDENQYCGLEYKFSVQDILVGEGSESSVAELRPAMVNKYSGSDPFSILNDSITESALLADKGITKEESMREYADLKFSLLLYDAILILAGTSIASLTAGENTALAFLIGGTGGFLYLLLLQRSVDELPASKQIPMDQESGISRLFGGVKGPLLVLGSAFGLAFLIAKRGTTDVETLLTPKEVVVGMSGFLMCKVAVVLAAFKPLSMSMKD